jgi:two-component system NarL family response regulator
MNKPLRIVVADDHPVVREGIASLIAREPDMTVVAEAADGVAAVETVLRHAPDVTLMDLRMPRMSGLEALRSIRRMRPAAAIVMLTTYDGEEDIDRAIADGAMGYLLKDLTSAKLLSAIRAVASGRRLVPEKMATNGRLALPPLTDREEAVLRLLAGGKSNKEIGVLLAISTETVKTHVKNVFLKLGVFDRTQAATAALRLGFVRMDDLLSAHSHPDYT